MPTTQEEIMECYALCRIIEAEPEVLTVLQRATVCSAHRSRWAAYSALKEQCRELVGWQAREEELRESRGSDAVVAALDAWLPTSEEWDRHRGHLLFEKEES